jgi:hypothetical protein
MVHMPGRAVHAPGGVQAAIAQNWSDGQDALSLHPDTRHFPSYLTLTPAEAAAHEFE